MRNKNDAKGRAHQQQRERLQGIERFHRFPSTQNWKFISTPRHFNRKTNNPRPGPVAHGKSGTIPKEERVGLLNRMPLDRLLAEVDDMPALAICLLDALRPSTDIRFSIPAGIAA
jgi:hypothetical protein